MKTQVIIWTETLEDAEQIWRRLFMNENWDIEKELSVRFNWESFKTMYYFRISKPTEFINSSEKQYTPTLNVV